jgi:hypothetical protein
MRTRFFLPWLLPLAAAAAAATPALLWPTEARAQVGDAERAAARDLFKQGDELQRAGNFTDALDRFQRAQQVIQAPTNVLRIAECQAALGKLVESAESYRAVIRWPLAAGAPPAFQSAIDQAKGELSQVDPRVPRLLVKVSPAGVANESLVIDGTAVSGALVGEPIPLDPGEHKVTVNAPGYASPEQAVTLRERETRTLNVELHATATGAPPPPVAPPANTGAGATPPPPAAYGPSQEPAEPPPFEPQAHPDRKDARGSILLGLHLGLEVPTGTIPISSSIPGAPGTAAAGDISGPGFAYAFDGGVRFLHHWYVGLTLEHASLATGKNPGNINADGSLTSDTTTFGLVGAFIANAEKPSFYGQVGLLSRWYNFKAPNATPNPIPDQSYAAGELMFGIGLWLPLGRYVRLIPLGTVGLGSFNIPGTDTGGAGHAFVMLGLEGLTNIDL